MSIERALTRAEKHALAAYFEPALLARVRLRIGRMPAYAPKWAIGLARGTTVYFRDPRQTFETIDDLALLAHELAHVVQYERGMNWLKYLWASRRGYRRNAYEQAAYAMGARVADDLVRRRALRA